VHAAVAIQQRDVQRVVQQRDVQRIVRRASLEW